MSKTSKTFLLFAKLQPIRWHRTTFWWGRQQWTNYRIYCKQGRKSHWNSHSCQTRWLNPHHTQQTRTTRTTIIIVHKQRLNRWRCDTKDKEFLEKLYNRGDQHTHLYFFFYFLRVKYLKIIKILYKIQIKVHIDWNRVLTKSVSGRPHN